MRRFVIATMFVLAAAVVADNQSNLASVGSESSPTSPDATKTTAAQGAAVEQNVGFVREG